MKNELQHIIEKHFSKDQNEVHFDTSDGISKKSLAKITIFCNKFIQYERPDIYAKIRNELLFIEHFEFDPSLSNKNGSLEKREINRIDKKEKEFFEDKQESCSFSDQIKSKASLDHLIKNVNNVFVNHINKTPDYIEHFKTDNLIDSKTKIMKCFFIESGSPYPCYVNTKEGPKLFNLFYADFFIQILEKYQNEIDYLFYSYTGQKEDILYFMDIKALPIYKKKCIKLNESSFIPIEPHVISAGLFIKDEVKFKIEKIPEDE